MIVLAYVRDVFYRVYIHHWEDMIQQYFELMEDNEQYKSLIDMGCDPVLSEASIRQLKSQDLSALLDWIEQHTGEEEQWKKWLEENKNAPAEEKVEGQTLNIENLVKKEFVEELMKQGHSKNVANKACLLSGNVSVSSAQHWIEEHKYDPDFEEEVIITGQEDKPKLTPEEAKEKLKELTEKARAIKKQREEEDALEREKSRMRSGKEMIEAKRIAQEQAAKRQIELDRIQKSKDDAYKKQLVEQMRREKCEKLGIKYEPGVEPVAKKKQVKYSKEEQLQIQCEQVKVGMHAYPDQALTFFKTAHIYVTNIIKNNGEEKFRRINKENKAFQNRIVACFGGVETLQVIGYEDQGDALVMSNWDMVTLQKIAGVLERYISLY